MILSTPDPVKDKGKLVIECDASGKALGAALYIQDEGTTRKNRRPVAFASRSLTDCETRYSNTDREGLAVIWAIECFEHWLHNDTFVVETDHSALLHIFKKGPLSSRFTRWAYQISDYDFTLRHVPGLSQVAADTLSRLDLPNNYNEVKLGPQARADDLRTESRSDPILKDEPVGLEDPRDSKTTLKEEAKDNSGTIKNEMTQLLNEIINKIILKDKKIKTNTIDEEITIDTLKNLDTPYESNMNIQQLFRAGYRAYQEMRRSTNGRPRFEATMKKDAKPLKDIIPQASIVTWNVDGLRSMCNKLPEVLNEEGPKQKQLARRFEKYLDSQGHSIVCIQETRLGKKYNTLIEGLAEMKNWNMIINDNRSGNSGVATFIHKSLKYNSKVGMMNKDIYIKEGRVITTVIDNLAIVNAYVPNGNRHEARQKFKLEFLEDLKSHCIELKKDYLVILACDMNVAPTDDDILIRLSEDPNLKEMKTSSPEEREFFRSFIDNGFHDAYRTHHEDSGYTWKFKYAGRFIPFWRIDHILVDDRIEKESFRVIVDWTVPTSDHARVKLFLDPKKIPILIDHERDVDYEADLTITHDPCTFYTARNSDERLNEEIPLFSKRVQELRAAQMNDPYFGDIFRYLKNGIRPEGITAEAMAARSLNYGIFHDLLYKIHDSPLILIRRSPVRPVLCIPDGFRREILKLLHDDLFAGHLGISKIKGTLLARFWWPTVNRDIMQHVNSCNICNKCKDLPKKMGTLHPVPIGNRPWERIGVDFVSTPKSDTGYEYIMVVVDYFTKWAEAIPLKTLSAEEVAKALVEEVFCRHGVPVFLHSDRGQPFTSALIARICKILGIKKTNTTPYWPRANGAIERFVKTISSMLRIFVNKHGHGDWDCYIPYVLFAYRTHIHRTTGETPYFMNCGRDARLPADLFFGITPTDEMETTADRMPHDDDSDDEEETNYVDDLNTLYLLDDIYPEITLNMTDSLKLPKSINNLENRTALTGDVDKLSVNELLEGCDATPRVNILVNGVATIAEIDTLATFTSMSIEIAERFGIKVAKIFPQETIYTGAGPITQELKVTEPVTFQYGDVIHTMRITLNDLKREHGCPIVLGLASLAPLGISVDAAMTLVRQATYETLRSEIKKPIKSYKEDLKGEKEQEFKTLVNIETKVDNNREEIKLIDKVLNNNEKYKNKAIRVTHPRDRVDELRTSVMTGQCARTMLTCSLAKKLWSYPVDVIPAEILVEFLVTYKIDVFYLVFEKFSGKGVPTKLPRMLYHRREDGITIQWNTRYIDKTLLNKTRIRMMIYYRTDVVYTDERKKEPGIDEVTSYYLRNDGSLVREYDESCTTIVDPMNVHTYEGTKIWDSTTSPILVDLKLITERDITTLCYLNIDDDLANTFINNDNYNVEDYCVRLTNGLEYAYDYIKKRVKKDKDALREWSLENQDDEYQFKAGDRAWLAVPLNNRAQSEKLPEKFLFRWVGPVRVIHVPLEENNAKTQITVVETFPGGEITVRTVHVSRLRPYTIRLPVDSAEDAARLAGDDYETEIKKFKTAVRLKKRPLGSQSIADTRDVEWLRRFDDEFDETEIENPSYEIEKIIKAVECGDRYQYLTKWKGFTRRHNSYQDEWDMPEEMINEYWKSIKDDNPQMYKKRQWFEKAYPNKIYRKAPNEAEPPEDEEEDNFEIVLPREIDISRNDRAIVQEDENDNSKTRRSRRIREKKRKNL